MSNIISYQILHNKKTNDCSIGVETKLGVFEFVSGLTHQMASDSIKSFPKGFAVDTKKLKRIGEEPIELRMAREKKERDDDLRDANIMIFVIFITPPIIHEIIRLWPW